MTEKRPNLSVEAAGLHGWVVLAVSSNVTTTDVLDGHVLNVEANVVTRSGLSKRLVVHLNRLDLSGNVGRGEGHNHTRLEDTSLHTAHGYCSNT